MQNVSSSQQNFQLIVGLGNYGPQYELTKHNIGWLVLDRYLDISNINTNLKDKLKGKYTEDSKSSPKRYFLYPQTYMNLSGECVRPFMGYYKIPQDGMIVLHDELDLPLGEVQFKMGGGSAGHNGLKSLEQHLGSNQYARLRIGVGRPEFGSVSDWVLGSWGKAEWPNVEKFIDYAAHSLKFLLEMGWSKAINQYNRKNILIQK
ncbi:MAG: aminoacyl-tRNA hydrolase [Bacteriovoracaceae bacterium]|nr:aminoacyl-tRNA hydrolase [Bacteriovoracaceae bacterium]